MYRQNRHGDEIVEMGFHTIMVQYIKVETEEKWPWLTQRFAENDQYLSISK